MPNDIFPRLGRIPTPLEVVDAGLDTVAEVVQLPARVGTRTLQAGSKTFEGVKAAVDVPKNQAEIPASPDAVVQGAVDGLTSIGGGVFAVISGVFDGAKETADGIKGQVDALVRR